MDDLDHANGPLKAGAARLKTILTVLILFLALVLVAERGTYAGLYGARADPNGPLLAAVLQQVVLAMPAIIYLGALWALRAAASAVASREPFGDAVVGSLRRVGYCLIGGSAVAMILMPSLRGHFAPGQTRLIDHDVATLIIAGVGLGLVFLARLVRHAAGVKADLDQIF